MTVHVNGTTATYTAGVLVRRFGAPDKMATVEVTIDLGDVAQSLGHKADRNKSRVTKLLRGSIRVRAL